MIRMLLSLTLQSFQQEDVTVLNPSRRSCLGNTMPKNHVKKHGQQGSSPNRMNLMWFKKSTPIELTKLSMRMDEDWAYQ